MKTELDNVFAKSTFAFSIFNIIFTIFEVNLYMIIAGLVFSVLGIVFGCVCIKKELKNVGKANIIISSAAILVSLVFMWMYFTK